MHPINRTFVRSLAPLTLVATTLVVSCSSDHAGTNGPDGGSDAASGGKQNGTGGNGSGGGGAGGESSGGSAGSGGGAAMGAAAGMGAAGSGAGGKTTTDAGAPDATLPDAGEADARVDAGPGPEAVLCADAGAVATSLLVAGTTFCSTCSTSEVAAVDLARGCVLGRTTFSDSDVVPRVSGDHGFVLQRTRGVLSVVSTSAALVSSVDLSDPHVDGGGPTPNPHDVVYVPDSGGAAKAFVSLYGASAVAVVNLEGGQVSSRVDLSSYHDASDSDGSSDPDVGFYDATTNRVYFVLQRTDLYSGTAPSYAIHCPPVPSVLVAIDGTTNQLVDLNGAAAGVALPLSFVAPDDIAIDTAGRRALILSNGCADETGTRVKAGIEAVNLDSLADTVLYTSTSGFLSDITLLTSSSGVVTRFDDDFATHYYLWSFDSAQLGAELTGVPSLPVAEDGSTLVGVAFEAEPRVKRFHVLAKTASTVVSSPWSGNFTTAAGNALFE